jgi:anti-sigma B factor antagonist
LGERISYQSAAFIREDFDAVIVLHVFGELDMSNTKTFEEAVLAAEPDMGSDRLLVIDLGSCTFLDSTALQVVVRAHQRNGDRLCVIVPEASVVQRVFRITNLDTRIPMAESLSKVLK